MWHANVLAHVMCGVFPNNVVFGDYFDRVARVGEQ